MLSQAFAAAWAQASNDRGNRLALPAAVGDRSIMPRNFKPKGPVLYLGLAVVYFVAGKLALQLAFLNASASAVWPCTGIALAALLLFGYRVGPAIFAGAFLVNFT